MNRWLRALALLLAAGASACASLSPQEQVRATALVQSARPHQVGCDRIASCATPSPLHQLGARAIVESAPGAPRHRALILDSGQDALLARISLLRSATTSIDLQTYIFDEDDAGLLFLDELLAAARRGVRVRMLVDQLSALKRVDTLAALSGAHANFSIRIYNPVLGRARLGYVQYLFAAACCWGELNKRMHTKLLLVDGVVGITGGRNYQDDYYDWDAEYNFRDRDVLVAGPVAREMAFNFNAFWGDPRSVPPYLLHDVGTALLESGVPPMQPPRYGNPERVAAALREVDEAGRIEALAAEALPVREVSYIADLPGKHERDDPVGATTHGLRELIESASDEVLLQTPYLVLSKPAQRMFRSMHRREDPPRVIVSTNSLASTDSFITYALSYKYKRRYLRDYGFEIHEYKPFPANAPIDLAATGAVLPPLADGDNRFREPLEAEYSALRYYTRSANERVPLERAGVRIGLHAKSLVVDERVGVIGTHNFDPRGDHYNTESAVVIEDRAFARALAASIRRDTAPANAWTIGRRPDATPFTGLEYSLAKISEKMPIFDLWPVRYAVSYEFVPGPGCPGPLSPFDPRFRECHEPVGDFPEVALGFKSILTRIFTAFGAGLAPIL
ncbi:MAG: phospholipase D family protein [Pseudomonadota bacterium]|nr:phospholipase D family protein [Pseudomonadota bacterium]